jgi:hypothetical protein
MGSITRITWMSGRPLIGMSGSLRRPDGGTVSGAYDRRRWSSRSPVVLIRTEQDCSETTTGVFHTSLGLLIVGSPGPTAVVLS